MDFQAGISETIEMQENARAFSSFLLVWRQRKLTNSEYSCFLALFILQVTPLIC